jgi:hypothetical protein
MQPGRSKNAVVVLVPKLDISKELLAMKKSLQSMRGDHSEEVEAAKKNLPQNFQKNSYK